MGFGLTAAHAPAPNSGPLEHEGPFPPGGQLIPPCFFKSPPTLASTSGPFGSPGLRA